LYSDFTCEHCGWIPGIENVVTTTRNPLAAVPIEGADAAETIFRAILGCPEADASTSTLLIDPPAVWDKVRVGQQVVENVCGKSLFVGEVFRDVAVIHPVPRTVSATLTLKHEEFNLLAIKEQVVARAGQFRVATVIAMALHCPALTRDEWVAARNNVLPDDHHNLVGQETQESFLASELVDACLNLTEREISVLHGILLSSADSRETSHCP
jgi:hypothetical protein